MVLSVLPTFAFAAEDSSSDDTGTVHSTGRLYVDYVGSRTVSDAAAKRAVSKTDLPSSYNSNTLGYISPVRNQGSYGTCWAHGAMGACEAYMVKHGVVSSDTGAAATTSLNLSEYHLAWYSYTNAYDKLGMLTGDKSAPYSAYLNLGGFGQMATYTLMRWEGLASESTSALAYSNASASGLGSTYAYNYNVAHVQNSVWIPTSNMAAIKAAIMEYGAGTFGYNHTDTYSNDTTGAYCYIQSASYGSDSFNYSNHDVTVVGWDDNYSKTNFNSASRPTNNGAWIIKNSWGTSYGSSGYYYISYEDSASLNDTCYFYEVEPVDNYDNNYQYDGTSNFSNYQTLSTGGSIANVFTANGSEMLDAVALCSWDEGVSYTLSIYTGVNSTTNPTSGTLATTQTGSLTYAGYYTIPLTTPVALTSGQKFAVVFTLTASADMSVPLDKSGSSSQYVTWTHTTHSNSSYYKTASASSWTDYSSTANYRIKAYTTDASYVITAASNNTSYGTVAVSGSTITATPASGYYAAGYTVSSGTATVTQSGNTFTVSASSNCTITINFAAKTTTSISYSENGTVTSTATPYLGDAVTLPAATVTPTGYTFVGWTTGAVTATTTKPTVYAAGASYTVSAATTLYAVYSYSEAGTGTSVYTLVTDAANLTTGSNVVIAASGYDYAIGTTQNSNNRAQVAVTKDTTANTLSFTGSVAEFTLGAGSTTGTYSFYDSTNSGYLYAASSSGNYLRTETTLSANSSWTITVADGVASVVANGSNSRKYMQYNATSSLFSCYSSASQKGLALYQKGAGSTTYYTTSVSGTTCTHANLTAVAAVAATCTAAGNSAYWHCPDCGKYFSDAAATTEITLASTVIAALGHNYTSTITTAATCTTAGVRTYTCSRCGDTYTEAIAALGHTASTTYGYDATNHWHICSVCGLACDDAAAHTWDGGVVTTAATASSAGVKTYTCTVCGATKTEEIPALGEQVTISFSVPAGVTAVASQSAYVNGTITLPTPTGTPSDTSHTYTFLGWIASSVDNQTSVGTYYAAGASYTVTAAATLKALYSYATTGTGSSTYTLVTDAASLTTGNNIVIAASGYDYAIGTTQNSNNRAQVAVTKDTTANTLSFTGSVAEFTLGAGSTTGTYSFYDSTNSGYLYAASSTSNYLRTETTLSANSSWTITIASGVATIVSNGSNTHNCLQYNATSSLFSAYASGNTQKTLALYQKGAGSTTYYTTEFSTTCTHANLTAVAAVAATCTAAGNSAYWHCPDCGKYFSDAAATTEITLASTVIPALGHTLTAVAATAATCTEAGNSAYWHCSVCGKYFSDAAATTEITLASTVIAALGHNYTSAITTAPTCTTAGVRTYTCSRCGDTYTEAIAALGHTLTATAAKAATCTEAGNSAYWHCSVCGKYFSDAAATTEITLASTVIPALGHSYTSAVTTAATCTTAGVMTYTCSRCGDTYTEAIPALGHTLTATAAKAATCTEAGNSAYWHCSVCGKYFSDAAATTEITLASTVIPATGHSYTYVDNGDGTHTGTCSVCGATVTENHTYVDGVCSACGAVEKLTDSSLVFYGKTVVFESDFSIKYYILKTLTDNYDEVYLNVTKTKYDNNGTVTGTETTKVSMGDYNSSYKAYSFKYAGIYSIEIGSNVSATIYGVKDGKTYEGATVGDYSIKQFCYNQLAKSTATAAYKTLLVDFLNYGASAQTYFGYNTSNLVNAELTTEQAACASTLQTINNDRADTTITNPTVTVSGCTLVFDSQIMMKFVFDPTTYLASGSLSDLTVVVKDSTGATLKTFASSEIAAYTTSTTLKAVSYTALNSTEMRKAVTFQVYANGVAVSNARTYSIQSYAYSKQSGTDTNLAALTANMIKYGDSMIAWKAQ
jgi:C1A family cysteine protease/DNA-directed RNA polymerase subunit RPC12/RpoP/predicted aconitase with swiveling domain